MNLPPENRDGREIGLSSRTLLDFWEQSRELGAESFGLELLAAANPDIAPSTLRRWSVSHRDAELLDLRSKWLGPDLPAVEPCPSCEQMVEICFRAGDLGLTSKAHSDEVLQKVVRVEGLEVTVRALTLGDLCDAESLSSPQAVRSFLLERATTSAEGEEISLDAEFEDQIELALEELDPAALIEIELQCPGCQCEWSRLFDAVRYFRDEMEGIVRRLMTEVAELALAFHWSERDILAMSPPRRHQYLEIARSCRSS